jgi:hypothetical protein
VETRTLAADIAAGKTVALDANGALVLADASTSDLSKVYGVVVTGGVTGEVAVVITGGKYTTGATMTPGVTYVQSATAGGLAPAADLSSGDYLVNVITAVTTTTAYVNIFRTGETIPA